MPAPSIGDRAMTVRMQRHTGALKAAMQRASDEVTTGRSADPARRLRGDLGPLAALDTALSRIGAWRGAAQAATTTLAAIQTTLSATDARAAALTPDLLSAASAGQEPQLSVIAAEARAAFEGAVAALNVQAGGRSVFAGAASDGPAVAGPAVMLDALMVAAAGAGSAAAAAAAVRDWFADPAGFAATGWLGSDTPLGPVQLGEGETVSIDIRATEPSIRDTLAGLAMAALVDRGLFPGQPALRAGLVREAADALIGASAARAETMARTGVLEARVARADTAAAAQRSAFTVARAGMVEVDGYAAATELEAAQTQVETIYALTARLARLSLADFLR
jgi:flagellar hook-associated protein 3 FlgL